MAKRAHQTAGLIAAGLLLLSGCSGPPVNPQTFTGPCPPMLGFGDVSWSPDGSRLALTVNVSGFDSIYLMNRDGSDLRRVGPEASANDRQPAWSPGPGGGRIAFSSDRDGGPSGPGQLQIYTMNADGSALTRLTNNQDTNQLPSWSADGSRIAYVSSPKGDNEVDVMDADGSHVSRLTRWGLPLDSVPDGVADGLHFVAADGYTGQPELFMMDPDGLNVSPILASLGLEIRQPDWSTGPGGDGRWIAFVADSYQSRAIFRMAADGSQLARLTNRPGGVDFQPKWSPDGRQIAFISFRDGYSEVYVMDADGSNQTRLTHNPANQKCLKWPW